jgi:hypothetical protein
MEQTQTRQRIFMGKPGKFAHFVRAIAGVISEAGDFEAVSLEPWRFCHGNSQQSGQ